MLCGFLMMVNILALYWLLITKYNKQWFFLYLGLSLKSLSMFCSIKSNKLFNANSYSLKKVVTTFFLLNQNKLQVLITKK